MPSHISQIIHFVSLTKCKVVLEGWRKARYAKEEKRRNLPGLPFPISGLRLGEKKIITLNKYEVIITLLE